MLVGVTILLLLVWGCVGITIFMKFHHDNQTLLQDFAQLKVKPRCRHILTATYIFLLCGPFIWILFLFLFVMSYWRPKT